MKEIKFRAWDTKSKKMYEPFTLQFAIGEDGYDTDGVVFLQFTGIKDRHGKEIYEGDVIKTPLGRKNNEPIYRNCTVQRWFMDHILQQSTVTAGEAGNMEQLGSLILSIQSYITDCDIEVIGNVYEHPHLLKDTAFAIL